MSRERADDISDPHRMVGVESLHQLFFAANNPYRHSASDGLSVHDHVGLNAKIFLRSTGRETKATEDLVEDQRYLSGVANLAELAEPSGVERTRALGLTHPARDQNRVTGRRQIGMEGLNGIYENCSNLVRTSSNDVKRGWIKILESQAVADRALATQTRLHTVPPAVVSPGEANDQLPASVESRQSDRGHHGFGAAHMKGHF